MISPRKILAIKNRSLGDTVLMTAPLLELKRAYPEARIHVLVSTAWTPVLEGHPAVDRIWSYTRHRDTPSRAKALARLAIQLRRERFDLVVNFHASPSSATLAFATGAPTRSIHFHGHKDKNRYSTVVVPGKGTLKPIIERDMDAVRALGIAVPEGRMPRIFLKDAELEAGAARLAALGMTGSVLGIGLGASRPSKSWPIDRFAAAAVSWCQRKKGSALAFLGPGEAPQGYAFLKAVDEILTSTVADVEERSRLRSRISTEQELPLRMLAAMVQRCGVFLGNDSGPKHVAVAVGTPTVTLFGPEHPFEWHPYPAERHPYFFVESLACRRDADPGMPAWCGLDVCVEERHRCMTQTGVEEVLASCEKQAQERRPEAGSS